MQPSHIHTIDASGQDLGRVRIWVTLTYFSRSEVKFFENGVTAITGEGSHAGFSYSHHRCI